MNVTIRLRCVEAPLLRDDFKLVLNEGVTVDNALKSLYNKYDISPMSYEQLMEAAYLVNSTAASKGFVLKEGDNVTVIRMLEGG